MSIGRWVDKEVVVHVHNGILLSYKKEHIWVRSNEVDEPRVYYTEWSKSERERQIQYINAYIRNLERWYWWSYMQDNNGKADVKNRLLESLSFILSVCDRFGCSNKTTPKAQWLHVTFIFLLILFPSIGNFCSPWSHSDPGRQRLHLGSFYAHHSNGKGVWEGSDYLTGSLGFIGQCKSCTGQDPPQVELGSVVQNQNTWEPPGWLLHLLGTRLC